MSAPTNSRNNEGISAEDLAAFIDTAKEDGLLRAVKEQPKVAGLLLGSRFEYDTYMVSCKSHYSGLPEYHKEINRIVTIGGIVLIALTLFAGWYVVACIALVLAALAVWLVNIRIATIGFNLEDWLNSKFSTNAALILLILICISLQVQYNLPTAICTVCWR